jgi:hypothetical protein
MVTDVCNSDNTTMEMISEIAKIRRNEKWSVPRVSWRAERTHQVHAHYNRRVHAKQKWGRRPLMDMRMIIGDDKNDGLSIAAARKPPSPSRMEADPSACIWSLTTLHDRMGSSGAVHTKVDPLDTELVPVVVDSRLFPARCGRELPLAGGAIFQWGRVWVAPLG